MEKSDNINYPPDISAELEDLYCKLNLRYERLKNKLNEEKYQAREMGYPENTAEIEPPLILLDELNLPVALVKEVLCDISEILGEVLEAEKETELKNFITSLQEGNVRLKEIIQSYPFEEELLQKINLDEQLFFKIMLFTLRPFLQWMAAGDENLESVKNRWQGRNCPVCGAVPELARLTEEDGRRILWCWLCGTEWRFSRLTCVNCGEDKAEGQLYFVVKDTPYRVDLCESCQGYLKVIDESKVPEKDRQSLNWLLNDLGTQHLDRLAQKEGYMRD